MYKHFLIPVDGSPCATAAVHDGIALARALGAEVTILTVHRPFHAYSLEPNLVAATAMAHAEQCASQGREDMRLAVDASQASGVRCRHVEAEKHRLSDAVIAAAADLGCDLIVMPAHDRTGLLSTSHVDNETVRLLQRSDLPVLVLHEAAGAPR